ncbi:MAG: hypothetical protein BYD32DRAFT_422971 [Podila humilis]|nr:MAG: hypothetical protein BYD32DRAFT_422971 [Podila humilis]
MGTNGGDHGSSPTTTQTASDTRSHPSNIHTTPTANAGCCLSESSTSCARDGNVNKSGNGRQRLDIQAATVDKVQADWAQQSCLTQGMQSLPSSTQLSASIAPAPLPSISNSVPSGPSLNSASAFVIEGLSPVVDAHVNVPGTVLPPAIIPFAQPLQFVKPQNNNNSSTKPSTLVQGPQPPLFAPPLEPQAARPRRQSLLTPTQLKRMSEDTMADNANSNNIRNYKPSEPKAKTKKRLHDAAKIPPTNAERPTQHRPSARNTPTLTFQPHHTEISTDRPSVSGRLLLHIPKIPGKVFEFVSLTLTLRLKESISWTRQDLTKFEIQKESWSQIAWEKSIRLHFQDKQVEEGEETVVKIKGNSELVSTSPSPKISTELPADEWRWEWLMPVTRNEVWPESFEGSMGMVWYEMEAKCHFRWVTEGHDDVTEFVYTTDLPTSTKDRSKKGRLQPLPASAKFKKASTSTAKSLAQVFGKLRTGGKAKKANYSGDFNLGTTEHDKYLRAALQKSTPTTTNVSGALSGLGAVALQDSVSNTSTSDKATSTKSQLQRRPLPFLIRKSLKLYFVRPPPKESSNKAFFLPPPSMALPNLPDTRRLKAIIPGARIQVQIQIPNIIPIPGYAQTSQLVPCSKTGGLVPVKGAIISPNLSDRYFGYSMKGKIADGTQRADPRYPDNFQVALTVRKVTQSDIGGNDILRRRYEYAGTHSQTPSALVSSSTSTNISQTMSNSSLQGFVRSPILSQPQSPSPSSLRHDSHSIIESDDNITMGVTVEQTAIALGDQQKSEDGVEGPSASFHSHKISWRKEVRVRKVKCEFWQKESCRIPTEDAPSRSIKIPLGPAYVFLDQEQDKDTATTPQDQDEESNISLETNLSFAEAGIAPSVVREERKPPVPPKTTRDVQSQDFTSQPPPNSGCKGASGQIYPGSNLYPQRSGNKPFTLLVPIPLDSTSLRQTFVWPSSATPSSVHATPYNHSIGLTSDQGAGFGSDMEYPSYPTLCDSPGGSSRPGNAPGFSSTALVKASSSNKARIEVKHYLTFRLSIDMLEFEGEPEEDSADSNTLDEHQSPTNSNTRQELPTFPALCTSSMPAYPFGISPPTSPNKASGISNRHNGAMSSMSIGLASGSSSVSSGQIGHNTNLSATASTRISTIQPALTFLNSTAGLLGVDLEENDVLTASPFFGTSYEGSQRRGSKESLGTARSTNSGTSSAVGTIGGLHSAQTTSSISDNSLGSQRGRVTGEGLMAGAIGAIKKKASSSLLANVAGPYGHLHPGPQRASKVSVQKLKDFVLRVPITVVVEADDQSRVAGAFGTASSSGDQNGTTETNESATSISADKSMAGASGQLRQPPSLSNRALKDDRGGYTMPERSARFRGTSSLGSSSILDDQDLLASVGTNSIQSMEASVGSDRALDDTLEKFGALHFKPDYMLDQQNLQFPEDATDDIAAEYDDEEDFGFQY